ncbi:MAG TPA: hypothetical protein PKA63_13105 [Oligoflexia bacterium]|nr:hypothetical protein [Oligoflexia bacterium]HMP49598.1 hypothetical protein [Oligoflexia bacterium]
MKISDFISLPDSEVFGGPEILTQGRVLPPPLKALYADYHGDWHKAHEYASSEESIEAAWVHAYLHRKEGDLSNARYWYRVAEKTVFKGTLEEEWKDIVLKLLSN